MLLLYWYIVLKSGSTIWSGPYDNYNDASLAFSNLSIPDDYLIISNLITESGS